MKVPATNAAIDAGLLDVDLPFSEASIVRMPPLLEFLLGRKVQAITIGSVILVDSGHHDAVVSGREPELLAHELVHVAQWASEGAIRFLARYVGDYVRLRLLGLDHRTAYRRIGYEWDAYEEAARIVQRT